MSRENDFSEIATAAATTGAEFAQSNFGKKLDLKNKRKAGEPMGPADVVTETDRETQRRVVEVLTERRQQRSSARRTMPQRLSRRRGVHG